MKLLKVLPPNGSQWAQEARSSQHHQSWKTLGFPSFSAQRLVVWNSEVAWASACFDTGKAAKDMRPSKYGLRGVWMRKWLQVETFSILTYTVIDFPRVWLDLCFWLESLSRDPQYVFSLGNRRCGKPTFLAIVGAIRRSQYPKWRKPRKSSQFAEVNIITNNFKYNFKWKWREIPSDQNSQQMSHVQASRGELWALHTDPAGGAARAGTFGFHPAVWHVTGRLGQDHNKGTSRLIGSQLRNGPRKIQTSYKSARYGSVFVGRVLPHCRIFSNEGCMKAGRTKSLRYWVSSVLMN